MPKEVKDKVPPPPPDSNEDQFAFITSPGPGFKIGNADFPANDPTGAPTVIFSPNAEISSSGSSQDFVLKADIGLLPVPAKGTDGAIVRVRGGSGRIEIFRP